MAEEAPACQGSGAPPPQQHQGYYAQPPPAEYAGQPPQYGAPVAVGTVVAPMAVAAPPPAPVNVPPGETRATAYHASVMTVMVLWIVAAIISFILGWAAEGATRSLRVFRIIGPCLYLAGTVFHFVRVSPCLGHRGVCCYQEDENEIRDRARKQSWRCTSWCFCAAGVLLFVLGIVPAILLLRHGQDQGVEESRDTRTIYVVFNLLSLAIIIGTYCIYLARMSCNNCNCLCPDDPADDI